MMLNYSKLETYNKTVRQQRKYLKFYIGALCYGLLLCVMNFFSSSKNIGLRSTSLQNKRPQLFAVWTYSRPPPIDELAMTEKLYCSYSPCAPLHQKVDFYPEPYMLNLKQFSGASEKFDTFVKHHTWYKFVHGVHFPHHVQSVAIISIIKTQPNACVRTLGEDRLRLVCSSDAKDFNKYDPTDANAVPPFAVQFFTENSVHPSNGMQGGTKKYGILDYTGHVDDLKTVANLEDEMQSLASLQFLPYLSDFVDTKYGIPSYEGHFLMNGWYGSEIAFPPNDKAEITMTSMHIESGMKPVIEANLQYFRDHNAKVGSIGAIDYVTLSYLRHDLGLDAYFSGTLTSTLIMTDTDRERTQIIIADYEEFKNPDLIPEKIIDRAIHIKTQVKWDEMDSRRRFKHTYDLMTVIASAKVVICFKVQTAFLAMANGAIVILVGDLRYMDSQFVGNGFLFHRQLPDNEWHHDLDHMKPNPGVHVFDRLRASFVEHLKASSMVHYDSANLFGMIPLKRLGANIAASLEYEVQDFFQLVITTPPESITWKMVRAIEAIFYHHPNAKVVVYSNTIPERDSKLDVFTDVGFDVEIESYSFQNFFDAANYIDSDIKLAFLAKLDELRKNQHWYTHEADLVKLFVLERNGGVMLDTDMHLVKAFPKSFVNVAAWRTLENDKVGTALLSFEKNNKFLKDMTKDAIDIAVNHYNRDWYHIFGSDLITEHFLVKHKGTEDLKVLSYKVFYPFEHESECFTTSEEALANPLDAVNTFAIHINTVDEHGYHIPLASGSFCDRILHEICIFCGDLFHIQKSV